MEEKYSSFSGSSEGSSSESGHTQSSYSSSEESNEPSVHKDPAKQYERYRRVMRYVLWSILVVLVVNFLITLFIPSSVLKKPANPANLTDISASPDGKVIIAIGTKNNFDLDEELMQGAKWPRNVILRNDSFGKGPWSTLDYYGGFPLKMLKMDWATGGGICIGNDGTYLTTADSGTTWDLKVIAIEGGILGQLEDIDMNWKTGQGICVGENGVILSTSNFGSNWSYVNEVFVNHPKGEIGDDQ